jgi:hypothetical protein
MPNPIKVVKKITAGTKRAVRLIDKKLMNDPVPRSESTRLNSSH